MSFAEFAAPRGATVPEHGRLRGLDIGNPHPQYAEAAHPHTFTTLSLGGLTISVVRKTGTLDGAGAATIAHGISGFATARILVAQAWYKGNSSEAAACSLFAVDGTSIHISGGVAGRAVTVAMFYASDGPAW